MKKPQIFSRTEDAKNFILKEFPGDLRMATPLGLGKPNFLLNSLYASFKNNAAKKLSLYTALSLTTPKLKTELEQRFLTPFFARHFGDYPNLEYAVDLQENKLPDNIRVHEFYFQASQNLHSPRAQMDYVSLNYTHVAQYIVENEIQVVVQLIAKGQGEYAGQYSLSCNPDITLDVADLYQKAGKRLCMVGVVHPDLPFLGMDAIVPDTFFEAILDSDEKKHELFALPKSPIDPVEYLIGLHASGLVKDDGTLQIGIGSLSDALVHCLVLREKDNHVFQTLYKNYHEKRENLPAELGTFQKGLYGTSEMVMDGFMELRKAGILKRLVFEVSEHKERYLHGAFFLGSKDFYEWLRRLSTKDFSGLNMTRVSLVNDLYDPEELAIRRQRKNARFFNTCMNVTLLGGAASDTLENGAVVSGVGGQYNFVAMSHELPDSNSILMLRSVRDKDGKRSSNIVWSNGQLTIPRHLRDVVITEYGVAFLKGKTDEEVIRALLNITDSEFQEELSLLAQKNGKLSNGYQIPAWAKNNTPAAIEQFYEQYAEHFPSFPFGSDYTPVEQNILLALLELKEKTYSKKKMLQVLWAGLGKKKEAKKAELERLQLYSIKSVKEWIYQKIMLGSLD